MGYRKNKEILKTIGRGLRQVPELAPAPVPPEIELCLKALEQAEAAARARHKDVDGSCPAQPVAEPMDQERLRSS